MFAWSTFDSERDVDFNGYLWVRPGGNVAVDPVPAGDHDRAHLTRLGGIAWIVITNSDHVRATEALRAAFGAQVAGPASERERFPIACDRWLDDGAELEGLRVLALDGSKTPGELALLLDDTTLITGDLVRAHRGGSLMMLPPPKLADVARARDSVRRLAALERVEAVLVGDGWPVFRDGHRLLGELVDSFA